VLQVIDLSDKVDAVDPTARSSDSVDLKAFREVMLQMEAAQKEAESKFVIIATGHTHPSTGQLDKNNHPSYHVDHFPLVTDEAKGHQKEMKGSASPAFIATKEHGVSIYQTDEGTWDGTFNPYGSNANVEGRQETDRYGIFDVYDFDGDHIYKDIRGDGAVDHDGNRDTYMATMPKDFKQRRAALLKQLSENKKRNGGRL